MLIQPLFLADVPIEGVAPIVVALGGACAALWRRGNVLQDRHEQQQLADKAVLVELVKEVVTALRENTDAIQEANRAS